MTRINRSTGAYWRRFLNSVFAEPYVTPRGRVIHRRADDSADVRRLLRMMSKVDEHFANTNQE